MKKILILIALISFSISTFGQKIEKDYYDQFTGKRVMFTGLEKLNWKYKNDRIGGKMELRFVLNDNYQYLVLHWYCKNYLEVPANAKIQFKLDNGKTITLKNEALTPATVGGTGISKKDVGVMLNCTGPVDRFATAIITAVRIYTNEGYFDFEIPFKEGEKIHKQYMLFSREMYIGGR